MPEILSLIESACTVIFTWVFNGTKGSVFTAALLHTAVDAPQMVCLLLWRPLLWVRQSAQAGLEKHATFCRLQRNERSNRIFWVFLV